MYLEADIGTIASFDGQVPALSGSASASGTLAKAYLGYSASGRSLTAHGADATFSSTVQNYSGMTTLRIGHLDTVPFYGWIRSIVYYPTQSSDAQIKILSAQGHMRAEAGRGGPRRAAKTDPQNPMRYTGVWRGGARRDLMVIRGTCFQRYPLRIPLVYTVSQPPL